MLGRLFSKKRTEAQRTDVILTLTPHIIRNAEITQEDLEPIWVGTEANITFRGGSPRVESDVEGPFDGNEGTPEEIQDAIRRRLQRLPRGLRPGETEEGEVLPEEGAPPPPPPTGVNLVPTAPPSDIFRQPTPEPDGAPAADRGGAAGGPRLPGLGLGHGLDRRADRLPPGRRAARGRHGGGGSPRSPRRRDRPCACGSPPAGSPCLRATRSRCGCRPRPAAPVSHLPLSLSFDPAVLAVEKVDAGDFLGGAGEAQVMSDSGRPGALVIGASRLGKVPGVKGTGTLARITFRALAAGSTRAGLRGQGARRRAQAPGRAHPPGPDRGGGRRARSPAAGGAGSGDREGSATGRR